ncbi:hypothetical protein PLICRDRAFT_142760 [Plicaturopsis crispa FD-325 SS-3]|nr:hypothetical protein PLICRDRAFT_142760 [Plicaturopsis crispa FD-325 SS-3]
MAGYNITRSVEELLERTNDKPPSFTVHLYPDYWTLNNGLNFLYTHQVASLLEDIRAHRIPVDFLELFDSAGVPFYDGCMIVELLDYRPQKSKDSPLEQPERTRVVLHPNSETLWADICLLNQKSGKTWTDENALEIESRLLLATAPPLCLAPDPHLTRIANSVLRVSTPTVPASLKRKAVALDPEEDETDKARRAKIIQFMNPRANRSHTPSYRILDAIQRKKEGRPASANGQPVPPPFTQPAQQAPQPQAVPMQSALSSSSTNNNDEPSKKKAKLTKKKPDMLQPPDNRPNTGAQQPINAFHQNIVNQQRSSPIPASQSPVPPQAQLQPPKPHTTPQQHANPQSQASPIQSFQPPVPSAHFLNQPPTGARNAQPKASGSNIPNTMPHPGNPVTTAQMQAQLFYLQAQQRLHPATQNQNQNGRSTPSGPPLSRSPLNPNANQGPAQRNSPMPANRQVASRSPMPPNPQAMTQMPSHPVQQHMTFPQGQFNPAHLRAMSQGNGSPHPQTLPAHLVNGGAQPSPPPSQDQQQQQPQPQQHHPAQQMMAQFPQMYGYQMNFGIPHNRLPPGYSWQVGMGRGIPGVVNGQHMVPGMVPNGTHPQQMPMGVGKAVPGQLQGR